MTLRNFILLTFFAALSQGSSHAQAREDKSSKLSHIKKTFEEINGYKNYRIVTIDDSEEFLGHGTDNGGSLNGYYKGDSLKKIVEWVGLSTRVVQNEYYFDRGKLVFVYSTDSRCKSNDSTGEIDCSKFDQVFRGRYYFNNGVLFHTILSDKEHEKTKQEDGKAFLISVKEYMKLLQQRRK